MRARTAYALLLLSALWLGTAVAADSKSRASEFLGKPAAPINSKVWVGTPVSLDAVKGNAVVLAFWNADAAC